MGTGNERGLNFNHHHLCLHAEPQTGYAKSTVAACPPQALFPLNLMCSHVDCFSKIQSPGAWGSSGSSVHSRLLRRRCLPEMTVRQGLLRPV